MTGICYPQDYTLGGASTILSRPFWTSGVAQRDCTIRPRDIENNHAETDTLGLLTFGNTSPRFLISVNLNDPA
jgi:hypothetical protein